VTGRRTRCESSRRRSVSFASRCVVHEDKISWPTRGPNVGWTIGSRAFEVGRNGAKWRETRQGHHFKPFSASSTTTADPRSTTQNGRRSRHSARPAARRGVTGVRPGTSSRMTSQGDSPRAVPEPLRARCGRHHNSCRWEQRPTGGIEVVVVVIVAQQDGVDRRELGRSHRRPGQLPRGRAPAEGVPSAGSSNVGSVSRRQPSTAISAVWPANVCDSDVGHGLAGSGRRAAHTAACSVAHDRA
jgi:hypothetical protein